MKSLREARSWRELKIACLMALALLCAGRAWERIEILLLKPVAAQRAIFGRIAVNPWEAKEVRATFGEDGMAATWRYTSPSLPAPTARCKRESVSGQSAFTHRQECWLALEGEVYRMKWERGVLTIDMYPPHRIS